MKDTEKIKKKYRKYKLKKLYNMSLEDYDALFVKQKGYCAICGKHHTKLKHRLVVDHSHVTGKIRGLLCHKCNRGIGEFNDDIISLNNAIKYLS